MIMRIKDQWNKPVLITENGIPDKDNKFRAQYITSHLQEVKRAMNDGANVLGYLHWALMDNFEWASNYKPEAKFGLFSISRDGRERLSETKVHSALFGTKGDDTINTGQSLPSSSRVIDDVILELLDTEGKNIEATTSIGQRDAVSVGVTKFGVRITESHEETGNLEAKVHWFFDTGVAVRYRLHYFLKGEDCNNDGNPDFERIKTTGAEAYESIIKESGNTTISDAAISRVYQEIWDIHSRW